MSDPLDLLDRRGRLRRIAIALAIAVPLREWLWHLFAYDHWPYGYRAGYADQMDLPDFAYVIPLVAAIATFVVVVIALRRAADRRFAGPTARLRPGLRRDRSPG